MNTRFAPAVVIVLCGLASFAAAGGHSPVPGQDEPTNANKVATDSAQRRRADLRAALQAQQQAAGEKQSARQLSQQDRAELRQQLRQQRDTGQRP